MKYSIRAYHIAERLKLKDVRERLQYEVKEISNYEIVVNLPGENAYILLYKFGSVVFFNVPEEEIEKQLANLVQFRTPSETSRTSDSYLIEIDKEGQNRIAFDRLILRELTYDSIKIVSVILAQSTALEYYEDIIESLLERTSVFTRRLEKEGEYLEKNVDLIKFIGLCLNIRQDVISNFYIVDSPDEVWENNDLERIFIELKAMFDIDDRYKALDHKIKIVQSSIDTIVDMTKSHRMTQLELTIIALFSIDIIISIFFKFY